MALDIFAEFATDESLENNGAWHKLGKGTELLVARGGNSAYSKMLSELMEKHQAVLDGNDKAAEDQWVEIIVKTMARTLLLGWKNVEYQGKALDYSVENAELLLKHKDFRLRVGKLADSMDAYRAKLEVKQGEA